MTSNYRFKAVQALDLPSGNDRVHVPEGAIFTVDMDAQQFVAFLSRLVVKHVELLDIDGKPPDATSTQPEVRRIGFY